MYRTESPYLLRDSEYLAARGLVYIRAHLCKCPFPSLSGPRGTPFQSFDWLINCNVICLFLKVLDKWWFCKE